MKSSREGTAIADVPIPLMKQIARERNTLAHGHFDQNPFDGSYDIVVKNVRASYSAERLDGLTDKADKALHALRYASAAHDSASRRAKSSANALFQLDRAIRSFNITVPLVPGDKLLFGMSFLQWPRRYGDSFVVKIFGHTFDFTQQTRADASPATVPPHENLVQNEI